LELEGKEAKQLGSLSRERGIDKAIEKKDTGHQPLEGTSVRHEGKVSLQWRHGRLCRQVDNHRERYPVHEGMSHVADCLL